MIDVDEEIDKKIFALLSEPCFNHLLAGNNAWEAKDKIKSLLRLQAVKIISIWDECERWDIKLNTDDYQGKDTDPEARKQYARLKELKEELRKQYLGEKDT